MVASCLLVSLPVKKKKADKFGIVPPIVKQKMTPQQLSAEPLLHGTMPSASRTEDETTTTFNTIGTNDDLSPLLDWSRGGVSQLVPLDDGHSPEGIQGSSPEKEKKSNQRVVYQLEAPAAVYVTDNAVTLDTCRAWYDTMTASATADGRAAWGTYVCMEEIYQYCQQQQLQDKGNKDNVEEYRHDLAIAVAAAFVRQAWQIESGTVEPTHSYAINDKSGETGQESIVKTISSCDTTTTTTTTTVTPENSTQPQPISQRDMPAWWKEREAHGVAVWALCAPAGAAVPYHVDYAEQVRYATGILATPLQGGILHCTPATIQGGDFYVYLHQSADESFQHYERHGYKSQRQPLDCDHHPACIKIPYRTNRLIHQAGYFPHGSTAITDLGGAAGRVVVGLNVFGAEVGPAVQAYPEHAPRFNAWVRRLRQARRKNDTADNQNPVQISLRALIQRHPEKARKWCRQQRKAQFQAAMQQLELHIHQTLAAHAAGSGIAVTQLQSSLGRLDGTYPSPDDVFVFVAHRCHGGLDALYQIVRNHDVGNDDADKLLHSDQRITLRKHPQGAE